MDIYCTEYTICSECMYRGLSRYQLLYTKDTLYRVLYTYTVHCNEYTWFPHSDMKVDPCIGISKYHAPSSSDIHTAVFCRPDSSCLSVPRTLAHQINSQLSHGKYRLSVSLNVWHNALLKCQPPKIYIFPGPWWSRLLVSAF